MFYVMKNFFEPKTCWFLIVSDRLQSHEKFSETQTVSIKSCDTHNLNSLRLQVLVYKVWPP